MRYSEVAVINVLSDKLTGAIVEKRNGHPAVSYCINRDYSGFYDGDFLDERQLHEAFETVISNLKRKSRFNIKKILVGVPGEFTSAVTKDIKRAFSVPKQITNQDVDKLFELDIMQRTKSGYSCINASPVCFSTDNGKRLVTAVNEVTSMLTCKMSYILAEKKFTDLLNSIGDENSVEFVYTSSVLAQIMYVLDENARDSGGKGIVFVDIGYVSSTVAIVFGDGILYQQSFSEGEGSVAGDISATLEIPFEHALNLTKRLSYHWECSEDDMFTVNADGKIYQYKAYDVMGAAIPALERIGNCIVKILKDSRLILSGAEQPICVTGSAFIEADGVSEVLEGVLSMPVTVIKSSHPDFAAAVTSSIAGLTEVAIRTKIRNA